MVDRDSQATERQEAGMWTSAAASPQENCGFFALLKRRHSIRSYSDAPVSETDIEKMLRCAMQTPSAVNEQPWEFIVIRDKVILDQVGVINRWAKFAKSAPLAILVCLNTRKEKEKGMGIVDIGMCSENLMLAATDLGLGSVFTGIYPLAERMAGFSSLCELPEYIAPIGLVIIGHPDKRDYTPKDYFNPDVIHQNKWTG